VVRPEDRIDGQKAPELASWTRSLLGPGRAHLALDLSQVDYVSSAGLRVFLTLHRDCQAGSGAFALLAPSEAVREVLDVSGFSTLLTILSSEDELPA
jgi:anti-anti-sigma factor